MEETVHEMWTIGANRLDKESLTASEWWSSTLGVVPYVSKNLTTRRLLRDQKYAG